MHSRGEVWRGGRAGVSVDLGEGAGIDSEIIEEQWSHCGEMERVRAALELGQESGRAGWEVQ